MVRPVREQLEHDRVIRQLQARYRRRYEVVINPAAEQNMAVGPPNAPIYPDLVVMSSERGRKLQAVVEVETPESVNNLEALAQWVSMGRLRVAFHLYIPAGSVDVARRLYTDLQVPVAELWSYHAIGDQIRFTLVYRAPAEVRAPRPRVAAAVPRRKSADRAAAKPSQRSRPKKTASKPTRTQKRR
jgi:hypothetical protein